MDDCPPQSCPHEALPEAVSPALESTAQEGHGVGSEEAMNMIRRVKHLSYEDRLKKLWLSVLDMKRF